MFARHPVVDVTWHEAVAYCRWLGERTGIDLGLPTSERWRFAAAGPQRLRWPWGDEFAPGRCNSLEAGFGTTTPVDAWPDGAGPFGTLDQAGNVWEWCADVIDGDWRLLHGGSWLDSAWGVRTERTLPADPARPTPNVGFRLFADGGG